MVFLGCVCGGKIVVDGNVEIEGNLEGIFETCVDGADDEKSLFVNVEAVRSLLKDPIFGKSGTGKNFNLLLLLLSMGKLMFERGVGDKVTSNEFFSNIVIFLDNTGILSINLLVVFIFIFGKDFVTDEFN